MRIIFLFTISIVILFFISSNHLWVDAAENKLSVRYENNFAPSFEILVDSEEKYTLDQSYSWIRDETSRYNLVSYSIDGGDYIPISRLARGNFTLDITMDSPHSVDLLAVPQYPIAVDGTVDYVFSPSSPTGDNWFDIDSDITIQVLSTKEIKKGQIRQQLTGWSLDKANMRTIPQGEPGLFSTEQIHMSDSHMVDFSLIEQYKVDVISEYGTVIGSGWYDAASRVTVSVNEPEQFLIRNILEGWEGSNLESKGNSAIVLVDAPKTVIAKWKTDYSQLIMVALIPVAVGVAFFARHERRKTKLRTAASPKLQESLGEKQVNINYSKEISSYISKKSVEKLDSMLDSELINKTRYAKIKEKLTSDD